jgi:tRNA wybutosine-synthesizing protein 3
VTLNQQNCPMIRSGFACAVIKSKMYMFGGRFVDQRSFSCVEVFDIQDNLWINCQESLAENKAEHTMDAIDNHIILFGGYEGQRLYNDLRLFDTKSSKWLNISPPGKSIAPSHRYGHSSIILNDGLLIFGGIDKQKPLNDLWRFCLIKGSWTQIKYTGIVTPLFRSTIIEAPQGLIIMGGAKGFQVSYILNSRNTATSFTSSISKDSKLVKYPLIFQCFLQDV